MSDNNLITIPIKKLDDLKYKLVSPLVLQAEDVIVSNEGDAERASLFLSKVSQGIKSLEEQRTNFTKPINDGLKAINSAFKLMSEPLEKVKRIVGDKILVWRRSENEKIARENERIAKEEERRRKIQDAHEEAGHLVSKPVEITRVDEISKKVGFAQTRKIWRWRLDAFSKLDDAYKTTNDVYINHKIREGVRDIKGLVVYEEEIIGVCK